MTSQGPTVTYRPLASLVVCLVSGLCLIAVLGVMWFAFSAQVRDAFKLVEVLTLLGFLAAALIVLYGIGRTRVAYDDVSIRIRNGFREHSLAWKQVEELRLDPGMPWLTMRTDDGRRLFVLAVQSSDGDRALAQLRQMRVRAIEAGGLTGGQGTGAAS